MWHGKVPLSGETSKFFFHEVMQGMQRYPAVFLSWPLQISRHVWSTLIFDRFNDVFCSFEGKLPEFACLVSSLSAYCPGLLRHNETCYESPKSATTVGNWAFICNEWRPGSLCFRLNFFLWLSAEDMEVSFPDLSEYTDADVAADANGECEIGKLGSSGPGQKDF